LASAPAFLPGQQGDRAERPTKWEMILKYLILFDIFSTNRKKHKGKIN